MTAPTPLLQKGQFSGHETFPFRTTWLPKAIAAVRRDPKVFGRGDAMVELGVGKNMVRSIRHWGLTTGLIEEDPDVHDNRGRVLRVSELGDRIFGDDGWDPYLEDPATLWLLHWQLASQTDRGTTWYWVFNHAPQLDFSREELVGWLLALAEQRGWSRVGRGTLKRDVDCFARTYVPGRRTKKHALEDTLDCPLIELMLLREVDGRLRIDRGPRPTLPDEVFAFALVRFLRGIESEQKTIPLEQIGFAPGSPGRVFALSETALLVRLEKIAHQTKGLIAYDDTAGLRQLLITQLPDELALLDAYYAQMREAA